MEPSPPPRRKPELPFYEAPEHVQTSAKIISEAKQKLAVRSQLRTVNTRRPVTPQDSQRKLFGESSVRDPNTRPPSAFSLGSRHFDSESRPVSGTRLMPLDHKPKAVIDPENIKAPKPPADPNRPVRRPSSRQRLVHQSISVDSSGEPAVGPIAKDRSSSLQDSKSLLGDAPITCDEAPKRTHSGPKERTIHPLDGAKSSSTESLSKAEGKGSGKRRSTERAESGYSSDVREGSAGSQRASSAGKSGSAGRREEETADESFFYNTKVNPLVEEMGTHVKDKDPEKLVELSDTLYTTLESAGVLGKNCKRRSAILKMVFRLLDLESPRLLLKLARLILALRVSGNNLTNVCKLVFKVSREERHDNHFLEDNILELLLSTILTADHITASDALVYCVGALKFLSGNAAALKQLVHLNCLETVVKLLIAINKTNAEQGKSESLGHILVQLTATLRNLAEVNQLRPQFLNLHAIEELGRTMETNYTDGDLMLNIARIFSKLTTHTDCCNVVAGQVSHLRSFLHLLKLYQRQEDLVVRLSFALGNLTAKSASARSNLFQQPKSLETLLSVAKYYLDMGLKARQISSEEPEKSDKPSASKSEDVLIKVIRVIANLSINDDTGQVIASNDSCIKLLIKILDTHDVQESEELVLNTLATFNNLAFHCMKDSALMRRQVDIGKALLQMMTVDHIEGMTEANRVFGNLSRERTMREFLVKHRVDEMMVVLLDSGKREVVFTAVGVLINLMADEDKRSVLKTQAGIKRLVDVLRDFGRSDWHLASMVCQTLWNYSGKITSAAACFGETGHQELADILIEYLDEESALDASLNPEYDEAMRDYIQEVWETEFCPVASQLLQRIECNSSQLEPLEQPS